jgi:hypothetical protein
VECGDGVKVVVVVDGYNDSSSVERVSVVNVVVIIKAEL